MKSSKFKKTLIKTLLGLFIILAFLFIFPNVGVAKQNNALKRSTYIALEKVTKLREKGEQTAALNKLKQLATKVKNTPYDYDIVRQQLVYSYMAAVYDIKASRKIAIAVIHNGLLPTDAIQSLTYLVVQISFELGDYKNGIKYVEDWISKREQPFSEAHYLAGYGYYQQQKLKPAEKHLKRAIVLEGKDTPMDWHKVLLAVYLDSRQHKKASSILHKLINKKPKESEWWKYLIQVYLTQNNLNKALATLVMAHKQSLVDDKELKQVIHLYAERGVPEKAARLMQVWLNKGKIKSNYKNQKLHYQLWYFAAEYEQAIKSLTNATKISKKADDYLLLGYLHYEQQNWKQAKEMFQEVLKIGVKDKARIQLILGMAAIKDNSPKVARQALNQAKQSSKYSDQADYWLIRIERQPSKSNN